ncbi:MAG TPA: hypothetical protein VGC08_15440, partial [Pedobacter sp.]
MQKDYQVKKGACFALFISILACVPNLLSLNAAYLFYVIEDAGTLFFNIFACWLIHHYFLFKNPKKKKYNNKKSLISITVCLLVILLVNYTEMYVCPAYGKLFYEKHNVANNGM